MSICEIKLYKPEYLPNPKNKQYAGAYLTPNYPIKGLNTTCWAVGMYVYYDPVFRKTIGDDKIFIEKCLLELNEPQIWPARGRRKKKKAPLYGFLELYNYKFKYDKEQDKPYFVLQATTTDKKNSNFYKSSIAGRRPRGRPRKKDVDE